MQSDSANQHARTILAVDNPDNLLPTVQPLLEAGGFRVLAPASPKETVTCATQETPQLVLLLTSSLEEPYFLELVHQLRTTQATAALPIVLVSRFGHEPDYVEMARAWGVTEVIARPVEPETIREKIEAHLQPSES